MKIFQLLLPLVILSCSSLNQNNTRRIPASGHLENKCIDLIKPIFDPIEAHVANFSRERNFVFAPLYDDFYSDFLNILKYLYREKIQIKNLPRNISFGKGDFISITHNKLYIGIETPRKLIEKFIQKYQVREHSQKIFKWSSFELDGTINSGDDLVRFFAIRDNYFEVSHQLLKEEVSILHFPKQVKIGSNPNKISYDDIQDELFMDFNLPFQDIEIFIKEFRQE